MKIGTYNLTFLFDEGTHLHSGKEYDFSQDFVKKRFTYFAKEINRLDPDILFLQELGGESALQKVLLETSASYNYFIAEPDRRGVGNAVIYKKDLECTCTSVSTNSGMPVFESEAPDTLGSQIWSRRDYVHLSTKINEEPVDMLGVHIKGNFLMWGPDRDIAPEDLSQTNAGDAVIRSEVFRFSQARSIRLFIDNLLDSGSKNIIVLGDFNSRTENKVYKLVMGHMKKLDSALAPILDQVPEEERYSLVGHINKGLIDHVLVSKNLMSKVGNIKIHNEDLYDHSTNPEAPYIIESDHAAITFNLNI